eukprot:c20741_g1_i2 orf=314-475(-)
MKNMGKGKPPGTRQQRLRRQHPTNSQLPQIEKRSGLLGSWGALSKKKKEQNYR